MLTLFAALACGLAGPEPGYSVHVRELTTPERITRVRLAADETVLDAIGRLREPPAEMGRVDVWVTRPGPDGKPLVLPVDWAGITEWGRTRTNFQLLPGDRLFLQRRVNE